MTTTNQTPLLNRMPVLPSSITPWKNLRKETSFKMDGISTRCRLDRVVTRAEAETVFQELDHSAGSASNCFSVLQDTKKQRMDRFA